MSAPNESRPARRWRTGAAVGIAVLVVALAVLALLPRTATATASLTVTPRTDAGADAALLLADRYTALAGSTGTLRAAREDDPALADVPLDELEAGTTAERAEGAATITVRVRLADRDDAAAAANAVVAALVEAGADEDLVDVDAVAQAVPARADVSPDRVRWAVVALLLALAAGITAAALAGRARHSGTTGSSTPPTVPADEGTDPDPAPAAAAGPGALLDDLPGFLENPPGSPPALPAAAAEAPVTVPVGPPGGTSPAPTRTGATAAPAAAPHPAASGRSAAVATSLTVLALVALAGAVGVTGGSPDTPASAAGRAPAAATPTGAAATLSAPTESAASGLDATAPTTPAPAPATGTAAAALALESVPLGDDGLAASVTFAGVVLEQRAVGLTVTYPSLSVTTDGSRSLAHVRLPTFNCLTAEPPEDPLAVGCVRSLTEYADLPSPQLQVSRDGASIEVVGLFPTYTRPNGSAPAYTGRAYQLTAAITSDGPGSDDGAVPAAGVVRIGLDSATTSADRGVNLLQLPD